jgi:hypothetical protein
VSDLFRPVPWSIQELVTAVRTGSLRLPDIQRPFVWEKVKVRDLVDSIYRGYPVGELMFWNVPGDEDTKSIGLEAKTQSATAKIVDGQQRITSLFVVLTGQPVVDDEYRKDRIRIAFNPFTERFEVTNAALEKSPDWIADISTVFKSVLRARKAFVKRYEESHALSEENEEHLEEVFDRLHGLKDFSFTVVELLASVDRETVAEIFVRINSEGVSLTQADFILTWLSVFWDEGRDELETFSRNSRLSPDTVTELFGEKTTWTPKNHYLNADPGQMLKVIVALGQNRGRLRNAYNALRGRDPRTGEVVAENRARELQRLKDAQAHTLNPTNWDDFLRVLSRAGFRSKKMITSKATVLYVYALWLIGLTEYGVDRTTLRDLMARWFFMAQMTGRYTSSPETIIEEDLARFNDLEPGDAEGFTNVLNQVISNVLTSDFWSINLPDDFVTSSTSASPAYQAYLAALNILDADLFASSTKIRDWMDPSAVTQRGVEGHHLFPKGYLKTLDITSVRRLNQVANFAPTDWVTNNLISDNPPSVYWPQLVEDRVLTGPVMQQQKFWHALPDSWETLDYDTFLTARRVLMAEATAAGYARLQDPSYQPMATSTFLSRSESLEVDVSVRELVTAGLLSAGQVLTAVDPDVKKVAVVTEDGLLAIDDRTYENPTRAARAIDEEQADGWEYWVVENPVGTNLRALANELNARGDAA